MSASPIAEIAADTHVVTDGHAGYNKKSLGERPHERKVQTKAQRRENDAVQSCHWTISLLKRWLLGTHAGAVRDKHLQAYLDEFAFRHNRRKTNGGADRGPRHRAACHARAAVKAENHRSDDAVPLVRLSSSDGHLS